MLGVKENGLIRYSGGVDTRYNGLIHITGIIMSESIIDIIVDSSYIAGLFNNGTMNMFY